MRASVRPSNCLSNRPFVKEGGEQTCRVTSQGSQEARRGDRKEEPLIGQRSKSDEKGEGRGDGHEEAFCCHIFILVYNLEFIKKDSLNSEASITRKDFKSTFPFKLTALSVQTPHQC